MAEGCAPLHLVDPATFARNLRDFATAGREAGIPLSIRYGKKANKSPAFIQEVATAEASSADFGVDAASPQEYRSAIAGGVDPGRIVVTGPTQTTAFYRQLIHDGALIALSTPGDAALVADLAHAASHPARVLLRLSPPTQSSRFGLVGREVNDTVIRYTEDLRFEGISFHCTGYRMEDRLTALDDAVEKMLLLEDHGLRPCTISIGGGIPIDYLTKTSGDASSPHRWRDYFSSLTSDMFVDGTIPKESYPYGTHPGGADYLAALLGRADTTVVRDRGWTVMVEPGRSLCSKAGASFFPVRSTRCPPGATCGITVVSGNSMSLSEQWFQSEFFPDPLLWDGRSPHPETGAHHRDRAFGTAVAGATCLESDYLSRRFIPMPRLPRPGDILIYPDTAGYQMDSNESEFHEVPLPRRFALRVSPDSDARLEVDAS